MSETPRDRDIRMAYEERFEAWRKLLPDSRLRTRATTIASPIGQVTRVYCINCGRPCGAVTTLPDPSVAIFLCQSCAERYGTLPVPEIPPDLIAQKEA